MWFKIHHIRNLLTKRLAFKSAGWLTTDEPPYLGRGKALKMVVKSSSCCCSGFQSLFLISPILPLISSSFRNNTRYPTPSSFLIFYLSPPNIHATLEFNICYCNNFTLWYLLCFGVITILLLLFALLVCCIYI